jgi:hypothetical protein
LFSPSDTLSNASLPHRRRNPRLPSSSLRRPFALLFHMSSALTRISSRTHARATAILVFGLAPLLIDSVSALSLGPRSPVDTVARLQETESTIAERLLDGMFGRSEYLAPVQAQASAATAYLRIASLSIALYEYVSDSLAAGSLCRPHPQSLFNSVRCANCPLLLPSLSDADKLRGCAI